MPTGFWEAGENGPKNAKTQIFARKKIPNLTFELSDDLKFAHEL